MTPEEQEDERREAEARRQINQLDERERRDVHRSCQWLPEFRGVADPAEAVDPLTYQSGCVDGFVASQVARGFSPTTIDNGTGVLERFLALAVKPAWELSPSDVDAVTAARSSGASGQSLRRDYVGTFKQFFTFLQARHAAENDASRTRRRRGGRAGAQRWGAASTSLAC
ncbi:MAG TPA: hypothetical protein VHN80_15885, partial [Kineosporiaceae bacterium]|nr:hypothetical protein [Kineosporiaceae bacterium]